jgi:methylglyoxal synthase
MGHKTLRIGEKKRIALIAHDNKKEDGTSPSPAIERLLILCSRPS